MQIPTKVNRLAQIPTKVDRLAQSSTKVDHLAQSLTMVNRFDSGANTNKVDRFNCDAKLDQGRPFRLWRKSEQIWTFPPSLLFI